MIANSTTIKYNTAAFMTGLFYKFKVDDPDIKATIGSLYFDLIDVIIQKAPQDKKIILFKELLLSIENTINYCKYVKETTGTIKIPVYIFNSIRSLITYNKILLEEVMLSNDNWGKIADQILNQVFIDDIACDIGSNIIEFKKSKSLREKISIVCILKSKLIDYNYVTGSDKTLKDVIKSVST